MTKQKWSVAEEVELVHVLVDEKAGGNLSENGFKPVVWKKVVDGLGALAAGDAVGPQKTMSQCKSRFQWVSHLPFSHDIVADHIQLKGDYKVVKDLCKQSGFGLEDKHQIVMAPDDVWVKYLMVCSFWLFSI